MKRYRLAIIEQSAVITEGLRALLRGDNDFEVVFSDTDLRKLAERFGVVEPNIVIINPQIAGALQQNIRSAYPEMQHTAIAAIATTVCDDELMRQFDAIINIFDSQMQIVRKLHAAIEQNQTNPYSDSHDLSERERDVLILVAKGLSNKEIADRLNISIHTVMSHRKNITHKTGIKSVAGLTVYALLNNLVDQNDMTL